MYPAFLPDRVTKLSEPTSIAMAAMIQQQGVLTSLRPDPIASTFVYQAENLAQDHPIVLLHGFDSSLLEFRRLFPQLAAQRNTWAIDLLGFGFTDRSIDITFSPTSIKTHLYALWKTLIKQPMILVGASMGGAAAIDFALTYPEAVAQLVLLDGAGFAKGPAVSGLLRRFPAIGPAIGQLATGFLSRTDVRENVSRRAYYDPALATTDATCCAALHLAMPRWAEALIDFTSSGGYNFLSDKISQITSPTLIIWGRHDKILGIRDADRFLQVIPKSQLVWIEACGHVPHLEQPAATATAILQFITNPESSH